MNMYSEKTAADVPTRAAAGLAGVFQATATRKPRVPLPLAAPALVPANPLSEVELGRILEVVNSPDYVDLTAIQIHSRLLDAGIYLGSLTTICRILAANKQVKGHRRLYRHPARAIPELVATSPGQVY